MLMSKYEPGQFSWVDLMTPDAAAARRFYEALFGWGAIDFPADAGGVYTQFTVGGSAAAGMGEMDEELKAAGTPAVWNSYVTVNDADAAAARAVELGGRVDMPVMQVMDAGRMAFLCDPEGARFAIWQPGAHIGAGVVNEPGSLVWNELATRDPSRAKTFYHELFGWTYRSLDPSPNPYQEIQLRERANGGILQMSEEWGDAPSHWMPYFAVADCDAAADQVAKIGGSVIMPPTDIPPGRFSVVRDPQGAVFTIMKVNQPD